MRTLHCRVGIYPDLVNNRTLRNDGIYPDLVK